MSFEEDALTYHSSGRKGKIEVVSTKPCYTQRDLALAYTPGVAEPCKKIAQNPDKVYDYTTKGNLVAVITKAALINALLVTGKKANEVKVVFNGGGAAAIACAKLFVSLGVSYKNLIMCDTKGVIYKGRVEGLNKYKAEFAVDTNARTLKD